MNIPELFDVAGDADELIPANRETPETLPEGHKIDWLDAAVPEDSPYRKYAMTMQTELAKSYGIYYEIHDSAGFDAYAEKAKAQGYKESYAICVNVDGVEHSFLTVADFKAALQTGCNKESVELYARHHRSHHQRPHRQRGREAECLEPRAPHYPRIRRRDPGASHSIHPADIRAGQRLHRRSGRCSSATTRQAS